MNFAALFFLAVALAGPIPPGGTTVAADSLDLTLSPSTCSASDAQLSCASSNSASKVFAGKDSGASCCVESEGLILQTQFWDYDVAGPEKAWTIHGLWPDKCDGTYSASCGFTDTVSDVSSALKSAGESALVDFMGEYWLNSGSSNEELWTHEFNKHGTCMSTLGKGCYNGTAVVDWAKLTIKTYQSLPTYDYLKAAGIEPSSSKKYSADDISAALEKGFGQKVYIGCKSGQLNEVWYFHKVKGSLLDDDLVKIDSVSSSTCSGQVSYLPKTSTK